MCPRPFALRSPSGRCARPISGNEHPERDVHPIAYAVRYLTVHPIERDRSISCISYMVPVSCTRTCRWVCDVYVHGRLVLLHMTTKVDAIERYRHVRRQCKRDRRTNRAGHALAGVQCVCVAPMSSLRYSQINKLMSCDRWTYTC